MPEEGTVNDNVQADDRETQGEISEVTPLWILKMPSTGYQGVVRWALRKQKTRFERSEMRMMRWMSGVSLMDRIESQNGPETDGGGAERKQAKMV